VSARTVAEQDFAAARRSKTLWAVAILLGGIAALLAYSYQGYRVGAVEEVQQLFRNFGLLLAVLVPIVALMATYLAIAGERESGGIKFLLGLPNTRREVFVGKLASRLAIVGGAVAFMFVAAASTALTRHGVLPVGVVVGMFVLTVMYGSAFVSVALAMSAAVASRGRAIAGAIGTYFALIVLYLIPVVSLTAIARGVHHGLLGMERNPNLYAAIKYTSPYVAFRKAQNLVLPDSMANIVFRNAREAAAREGANSEQAAAGPTPYPDVSAVELPVYLGDEVSLLVLAFWLVVPLAIGYLLFERAELE
jgi:ABC-2 type transport system permease protein